MSLDARLYRDVNGLAVHSAWLHPIARAYLDWLGFVLIALCVVAAWARGRFRPDAPVAVASALWAAGAGAVAVAVTQPLVHAVDRARPYEAMRGLEVLVARSHGLSFPAEAAVVAGAAAGALWWSDRRAAAVCSVCALVLALSCVYAGASYPSDAAAGLLVGALVASVLRPPGLVVLRWLAVKVERSPLHLVVAAHRV